MPVKKNKMAIVKYLIHHHAKINLVNEDGQSSLMLACEKGHLEIVKYLMKIMPMYLF